ncbi:collagen binding domain-containing protein [Actinokineospora guangxiensis]|uniref:Collagen binding domain-containing protein n=1 Tax=Actinokineospora guangxiensis TaxID=1490288 RepID=A0ABW0ELK6_9PSEU
MARTPIGARLAAALTSAAVIACVTTVVTAPAAAAAVKEGLGHRTTPAQPYRGNQDAYDWLGSYVVNGEQVWCVQYAHTAPDSDEQYRPGEQLKTKWGTALPADVAADISYLLLRYTTTESRDEAAALAHLLHTWTASPQNAGQLDPSNGFREIAYDAPFHLSKLPAGARKAVDDLKADAAANRGPWTAAVTAPTAPQVIGTPDTWTVDVRNARDRGVADVEITVTLTDATVDGETTATVSTGADGTPAALEVTPTGPDPKVSVSLLSPAERPVVRQAVQVDIQRVVSTGGEKELTASKAVTAVTPPGGVAVAKVDKKTGKAIKGVSLRLTGADKTSPALDQDGEPLVGPDDKPVVLVTGEDGTAEVDNLRTPQEVCVVEVAAPPGYDDAFDPDNPPSACGVVEPGDTVTLKLANVPNKPTVPRTIPAGDEPAAAALTSGDGGPSTGLLTGIGALAALLVAALGLLVHQARRRREVVSRGMQRDWGY